jgi:hypothetical protein
MVLWYYCSESARTEDKSDYIFYEGIFDRFLTFRTKILLRDYIEKLKTEDDFKPTVRNESLHEISSSIAVRLINFAPLKDPTVNSTKLSHHNIHKYTWTSPDGKMHNQIDNVFVDKRRHSSAINVR